MGSVSAIVWCVCRERQDERESMFVCGCVRECTRAQCYMCLLPSANLWVFALGFCVLVSVLITVSLFGSVCACACVCAHAISHALLQQQLVCAVLVRSRVRVCPHQGLATLRKHATGHEDRPCSHGGLILTSWLLVWPK
jgi:hypothetical protein